MKILHLLSQQLTGAEVYASTLAAVQVRRGDVVYGVSDSFTLQFSRRLMEAAEVKERLHRIATVLVETFHAEVVILLPNEIGKLTVLEHSGPESSLGENEYAVATWVFHHGQPAGRGTNTLSSVQWRFLPLLTDHTVFGIVGLKLAQPSLSPEEHLLLEAFVNVAELALRGVVGGPVRAA
jgi:two-component system sensor histidine kinase KdpD